MTPWRGRAAFIAMRAVVPDFLPQSFIIVEEGVNSVLSDAVAG